MEVEQAENPTAQQTSNKNRAIMFYQVIISRIGPKEILRALLSGQSTPASRNFSRDRALRRFKRVESFHPLGMETVVSKN